MHGIPGGRRVLALVGALLLIAGAIAGIEGLSVPGGRAAPPPAGVLPLPAGDEPGPPLPEITGITAWLNSEPLTLERLRGRVVLVDFWTYSCVNCLRTFPYLKDWNRKYASRGLTIIGVHSPEFGFERDLGNVRLAVQKYGVTWPVAMDNDFSTWHAYLNRYWPQKYLADAEGRARYIHIGEGAYRETEERIRGLLAEAGYDVSDIPVGADQGEFPREVQITREIYAGREYAFGEYLGSGAVTREGSAGSYRDPGTYEDGRFYLDGTWADVAEAVRSEAGMAEDQPQIAIRYRAASANAVLAAPEGTATLRIELDGRPVPPEAAGDDVVYEPSGRSYLRIGHARMYSLVRGPGVEGHELRLVVESGRLDLYTFTFSPT